MMKLAQKPQSAPAPVVTAQTTPATASPPAAEPIQGEPAPAPTPMTHHSTPMRPAPPETASQSLPAAQPAQTDQPAPQPMVEPAGLQQPPAPSAPPIANTEPATAPDPEPASQTEPPAPKAPNSVTLKTGISLPVRIGEALSSEHNQAGDTFTATLDAPLSAGGFVIAEKGARLEGRVVEAQKSGHGKKAALSLELTKLNTSDGQHVEIKTETYRQQGGSMAANDQVGIVAAAAGIGAIIGAMAGGGKGAAIGAGAGGAAGGGGVVATRDKAVNLPTESKLSFRLSAPVTLTEQVNH